VSGNSDNQLDLKRDLSFKLNGADTDLDRYPSAKSAGPSRTIEIGAQSTVEILVHGLKPGDYTGTLRFSAVNSAADDAQKLTLTVHVRDSIWWAMVWLLGAVAISFIGTKVVSTLRRRANLLQQIHALQPHWFSLLPATPPVVWLRATLHQTERLSKRFWLTSPDLLDANLSDAQRMLTVLDSIRQLREHLQIGLDPLVFRRVAIALDHVTARLGTSPLNETAIQNINAELANYKDWLTDRFPSLFWKDIRPALLSLQSEIAGSAWPDALAQNLLNDLNALTAAISGALATPPTDGDALVALYQQYARLRILWDEHTTLGELIGPPPPDIIHLFELADQKEWNRIGDDLQICPPKATDPDGLEAYQVVPFSVTASDLRTERTYLFRHKVEFHWTFRLTPTKTLPEKWGWKRPPAEVVLEPVSLGPSVVQYFPRQGDVHASVTLGVRESIEVGGARFTHSHRPTLIRFPPVQNPRRNGNRVMVDCRPRSADYRPIDVLLQRHIVGNVHRLSHAASLGSRRRPRQELPSGPTNECRHRASPRWPLVEPLPLVAARYHFIYLHTESDNECNSLVRTSSAAASSGLAWPRR
jgi:hypothetical protein